MKKMIAWLRPHEKKKFKQIINKRFPCIFAKTFKELKSIIGSDSYVIVSLGKLNSNFSKIKTLDCPNKIHYLVIDDHEVITSKQIKALEFDNACFGQFTTEELIDNFTGKIEDLEKLREKQAISLLNCWKKKY